MIRIYLTNFGYFSQREAKDLEEAKEIAKEFCFSCTFYEDDKIIGTWSPISGFHPV